MFVNVPYRAPGCHGVDVCLLMCRTEHQAAMVLMRKDYNQQVDKLQVMFIFVSGVCFLFTRSFVAFSFALFLLLLLLFLFSLFLSLLLLFFSVLCLLFFPFVSSSFFSFLLTLLAS